MSRRKYSVFSHHKKMEKSDSELGHINKSYTNYKKKKKQPDNNVAWQYTKIREIKEKTANSTQIQTDSADQNLPEAVTKKRSRSLFKGVNMKKYKNVSKRIFLLLAYCCSPPKIIVFFPHNKTKQ